MIPCISLSVRIIVVYIFMYRRSTHYCARKYLAGCGVASGLRGSERRAAATAAASAVADVLFRSGRFICRSISLLSSTMRLCGWRKYVGVHPTPLKRTARPSPLYTLPAVCVLRILRPVRLVPTDSICGVYVVVKSYWVSCIACRRWRAAVAFVSLLGWQQTTCGSERYGDAV